MTQRDSAAIRAELEEATAPRKKGELKTELVEALTAELAAAHEKVDDLESQAALSQSYAAEAPAEAPTEVFSTATPANFTSEACLIDKIVERIGAEAKPGVRQAFIYNAVRQAINTRRVIIDIATVNADGTVDMPAWPSDRDRNTGELLEQKPEVKPSTPVTFESEAAMEARVEAEKEERIAAALAAAEAGGRTMSEDERKIVAAGLGGGAPRL